MNHLSNPIVSADRSLCLDGNCGFSVDANRVVITAGAIRNLRDVDNLSGTLAIELWALKQPLQNQEPESQSSSHRLAATTIGEISGQYFLADCRYDLVFEQPAPGSWHIALLLREWNGQGYDTRDVVNFAIPYQLNWQPEVVTSKDNVVSLPSQGADKEENKTETAVKVAKPSAGKKTTAKPTTAKTAKAGKTVKVAEKVAVNSASVDEIAAIKGVSKKLAEQIVASRPYRKLPDMLKVKGLGEKLLEKISAQINLK